MANDQKCADDEQRKNELQDTNKKLDDASKERDDLKEMNSSLDEGIKSANARIVSLVWWKRLGLLITAISASWGIVVTFRPELPARIWALLDLLVVLWRSFF